MAEGMTLEVIGADTLARTLADYAAALADQRIPGRQAAEAILAGAVVPVDTGYLAASAFTAPGTHATRFGWSAPYAGYVDARTRFARRAIRAGRPDAVAAYDDYATARAQEVRGK